MASRQRVEDSSRTQAPSAHLTPSQLLAKEGYKFGRIIGEGSYCKVREVEQGGRMMAVKIISRENASSEFLRRFLPRELEILQGLDHPHVIKVYRLMEFSSHVYIFMELIERGDLLDFIRDRGRLSETEARHYFRQLVSAIRYLHSSQIAHRDLKCENILLTEDDDIKLIDFGFCRKCVSATTGKRSLSKTYCGSTAYAAPEVLMGIPYNPMMYDVWSLGCVLFIMVTGSMPFDDSNVKDMVSHQLKRRIRFPGVTNLLSTEVKDLIRHMLEPDVTKRATVDHVIRNAWFRGNGGKRSRDEKGKKDTSEK